MVSEYGILAHDRFVECVIGDYACTFIDLDEALKFMAKELVENG